VTYKYNSYIITSAEGETVIVDPTEMPGKDVIDLNPAAIVNTHAHGDHNDLADSDS
jgi:glyoxylase-like metal-dependent hydrolase (beta-lactamase superfamily II)